MEKYPSLYELYVTKSKNDNTLLFYMFNNDKASWLLRQNDVYINSD